MSAPFFYKRPSNALPYVTIAHVNPGSPVNMCICVAQPLGYAVHWTGRAVMCPGDECPMCRSNSRRDVFSLVGFHGSDRKMLEVGPGTIDNMRSQLAQQGLNTFEGTCWQFFKTKRNLPIAANFIKQVKTSPLMSITHLRVVARCFGLCDAHEEETVEQYTTEIGLAARRSIQKAMVDLGQVDVRSTLA